MKVKIASILALVVLLTLVVAPVSLASSTTAIIADAADGTINGHWSATQVRAALAYLATHPVAQQYSDTQAVLLDYLGSLQAPGALPVSGQGQLNKSHMAPWEAQLAFTGSSLPVVFGAGVVLIAGGLFLRRRYS
jgi:hypothetical protein